MEYRIIIETERSGKQWFYVQKSFLLYFWLYLRRVKDVSMYAYRIQFDTLEEAQMCIQDQVNNDYSNWQKRICKREIYQK